MTLFDTPGKDVILRAANMETSGEPCSVRSRVKGNARELAVK